VAISLAAPSSGGGVHFETANWVAGELLRQIRHHPLPADTILNVNVPDLPLAELRGWRATRLGQRHKAEGVIRSQDPRGREIFWIGPAGPEADAGPGTDFHAIREGCVSVTPLQIDLTRYDSIDALTSWLPQEAPQA
jgi:5'-nucleotidase